MTSSDVVDLAVSEDEVSVHTHVGKWQFRVHLASVRRTAVRTWLDALRRDGWRPVGRPTVDIEEDENIPGRGRPVVHGYVVRQTDIEEVTRQEPFKRLGNLGGDRALAVAGWHELVSSMGRVPVGPLSAVWVPGPLGTGAWEVTGSTRPRDDGDGLVEARGSAGR